jgi:hypothetical protein
VKRRALLIVAVAIIACAGLAAFALRDRTPLLTRAGLREAQDRWDKGAPSDYDLELRVEIDGAAPQRYRTEVRRGKVARFEQNGRPGEGGAEYHVSGLFEWMERELEMSARPQVPGAPAHATLKALFDPQRGYPLIFKRLASDRQSVFIRVERFTQKK